MADTSASPGPGALPIEPRIQERLDSVQRSQSRRRLKVMAGIGGAVGLLALAFGITRLPVLAVQHVNLTGNEHTPRAAVLRVTGLDKHPQMLDLNSGHLTRELMSLPWVASVQVHRHWPTTVSVHVSERVPVAQVAGPDHQPAVVDRDGRVLATGVNAAAVIAAPSAAASSLAGPSGAAPTPTGSSVASSSPALSSPASLSPASSPPGSPASSPRTSSATAALPALKGIGSAGPAGTFLTLSLGGRDALALAAALPPALPPNFSGRVREISMRENGELEATLTPGLTVLFGSVDGLDVKLLSLRTLLERVDLRGVVRLDVHVPDAPVLTHQGQGSTVSTVPRG